MAEPADIRNGQPHALTFSIVVPTYNSAHYIARCLASIQGLGTPQQDYEVIVVDGGSTDGTRDIVSSCSAAQIVPSPNTSISNSRNLGAAASKGRILAFIDSDCLVDPQLLEVARRHLEEYVCFGAFYKPDPSHNWISRIWLLIEGKPRGLVPWVTAGTLLIRKEIFEEIGGFDESLSTGEDVDLGHRVLAAGFDIFHEPSVGSIHLGQPEDLPTFFRKEMWRGKGIWGGIRQHGVLSRPSRFSLVIMIYLVAMILLPISILLGWWGLAVIIAAIMVGLPSLLAARKALALRNLHSFPGMVALYFVFLAARGCAVLRNFNPRL